MKNGIVKIWVCQACEKEYIERPLMCSGCECLDFYVKFAGILNDADNLKGLVDKNKNDEDEKKKKVRM